MIICKRTAHLDDHFQTTTTTGVTGEGLPEWQGWLGVDRRRRRRKRRGKNRRRRKEEEEKENCRRWDGTGSIRGPCGPKKVIRRFSKGRTICRRSSLARHRVNTETTPAQSVFEQRSYLVSSPAASSLNKYHIDGQKCRASDGCSLNIKS